MDYYHPRVLLLGNGLQRCFLAESLSWKSLIEKMTINNNIPENLSGIPFDLELILRTNDRVDKQIRSIAQELDNEVFDEEYLLMINTILSLGFDEIITTNYDFHLECKALGVNKLSDYQYRKITRNQKPGTRAEAKYYISTAQKIEQSEKSKPVRVWHIHGHARNPDSMIMGHYYYGNLIHKYKEHIDSVGNNYERAYYSGTPYNCNSWIDSFILGDVYIMGFGFDFAEIDLWWLINRKAREKSDIKGRTVFYEPIEKEGFNAKKELLSVYGVDTDTSLGVSITGADSDEKNKEYRDYYRRVIQDMKNRLQQF